MSADGTRRADLGEGTILSLLKDIVSVNIYMHIIESRPETLEDETLEDETLEDETLDDETLEDETLEDETLEDETLEDETLEDETTLEGYFGTIYMLFWGVLFVGWFASLIFLDMFT